MTESANDSDVVRLDFAPHDIRLRVTSPMEARWRARSCSKEPWTVAWLERWVEPRQVLYDIGANVGTFSLIAALHCRAYVVAFEPGYANYARLCENVQLNGCQHTVVPVPLPLSDRCGMAGFKYRSVDPGQSRHALGEPRWRFRNTPPDLEGRYVQPMCMLTLDDAVERFGLPAPHHVKIDVDGAEARVLAGAVRTLAAPDVRSVLIESDDALWDGVVARLEQSGVRLRERFGARKAGAPTYGLFVRG
jgi:FkbM family methyltransferase